MLDLLWSDPALKETDISIKGPHERRDKKQQGFIVRFGPQRIKQFLNDNNLLMIIRSHEPVLNGIQEFCNGQLLTIFSATNYGGQYMNNGAGLKITKQCKMVPLKLPPT